MAGPEEFLVVLMTALILPGIAILVTAFLLGSLKDMESVKYVVVQDPDDWEADDPAQPHGEDGPGRWEM